MLPGTSLCRLGFPFHQINATFDPVTRKFALAPDVLPIPRFPNDGIHTRVPVVISPDGQRQVKFIETSSPGLKGQSGGPIFDQSGFCVGATEQDAIDGSAGLPLRSKKATARLSNTSLCTSGGVAMWRKS